MSHRNQSGYTILEVLIVMVITGMIALPLSSFAINGLRAYNYIEAQSNTSVELNILAGRLTKVIRGATTIDTATSNSLTFYGYFSPQDTVIKKIRYFISGNSIEVGVTPPSGTAPNYTYDPAAEVVKVMRSDMAMGANNLFTYYDDVGNALTGGFTVGQVKQIGIFVAANPNTTQVPVAISVSTKVTLRNQKVNL